MKEGFFEIIFELMDEMVVMHGMHARNSKHVLTQQYHVNYGEM